MSKEQLEYLPQLRFKKFTQGWKKYRIDTFLERYSDPVQVEEDINYREIGVRSHGKGIFHKELTNFKKLGNKRVFWVHPNAFIVNIVFAWEQAIALTSDNEDGLIASHRFPMYIPKDDLVDLKYLLYFFLKPYGKYLLELASPGGAGRNKTLGQNNFNELKIHLPSKQEQQKIASFLTSIDTKIEQLTKKEELLKQYKKGIMQKIFSQEIRFKADDGREFPNWEEKKFGDVYKFYQTNSFSRALLNYDNGKVKNIHYGDIHTKFKSHFNICEEKVPYINQQVDLEKVKYESFCQEKDLIIADASEDYHDIGKTIEVINLNNEKLLAGLHTYIARNENNTIAKSFGGYLMQSFIVRLQIMKMATGISVLGVSKKNLSKVRFLLPSLEEQTKIANFLLSIDRKIEQVQTQLEATKKFKKGLLQQMFV